ncbi:MAG: hypothetical protein R2911_31395 [Caldilineaceae bacterium]
MIRRHGRRHLHRLRRTARPPAPTHRPCSLRRPKPHTWRCCPKASPNAAIAVLMVNAMDAEDFGGCTNIGECEAVCPKGISLDFIAQLNRDLIKASLMGAGRGD